MVGGWAVDAGMTVVSSVSELLPEWDLKVGDEAVFESVPATVGVTTRLTVALAPAVIVPRSQTMVLVPVQLPWLGVTETKFTPAGKVSVIVAASTAGIDVGYGDGVGQVAAHLDRVGRVGLVTARSGSGR